MRELMQGRVGRGVVGVAFALGALCVLGSCQSNGATPVGEEGSAAARGRIAVASDANNPAAAKFALMSAYENFKMKRAVADGAYHAWAKTTISAWEFFRRHPTMTKDGKSEALAPPFSDYGAEAEFTLIDEEIHANFDYETGHHKYAGATEDIIGKFDKNGMQLKVGSYQADAKDAKKYDEQLEHIVITYPSLEWVPAAIARQGTLYDSLRTGLYNAVPVYFTPQQEKLLKQLEDSGRQNFQDQAAELRTQVKEAWRTKKERELAGADELMVRRYATAVMLARQFNVRNEHVTHAIARLAYHTDIIGDAKIREYVTKTADPTDPEEDPSRKRRMQYTDGMFVQSRPGLTATPPANGQGLPLPAAP